MADSDQQFDAIFGSTPTNEPALEAEVAEFEAAQEKQHEIVEEVEEEVSADPAASKDHGEAQAESAPRAEPKPEPKAADVVPLAVFLETKNEAKELRRQLEEMRAPRQQEQAPPQPEGPPVFQPTAKMEDDPATFLREQNEHLARLQQYHAQQLAQVQAWAAHQSRQAQETAARQQFTQVVTQAEDAFRQQAPDYDEALNWFREGRLRELRGSAEESGIEFDEAMAYQAITQDFARMAATSLQRGVNPAKVLYRMAKERGFTPKQTASPVERIEKGMQASKSSQALGGRTAAPAVESTGDFIKDLQRSAGHRS